MPGAARVEFRPFAGDFLDLKVSAGTVSPAAMTAARNCFRRDDNTPTRRDGFLSYHERLDLAGGILTTESPATYVVGGIHQMTRYRNTRRSPVTAILAKVDEFLVASAFGRRFTTPLGRGLGGSEHLADFTDFVRADDGLGYTIVMTTDADFPPSYWDGKHTAWGAGAGHTAKWGFLQKIEGLPNGIFAIEHNGRLFVMSQDRTTIYYSAGLDFLDWANGGAFPLNLTFGKGTGFFRTYYGELLVGQQDGIMRAGFDGAGDIQSLVPLTTEVGLVNNRCTAQIGGELYFFGTKGQIHGVSTTDRFGDLAQGAVSQRVFERFSRMPESAWEAAFLLDDPTHHVLWIGHSRGGGRRNDILTGWDYRHDQWLDDIENKAIGPPSCGAILRTSRYQDRRAYFGTYSLNTHEPGVMGTAGRLWTFNPLHKEDVVVFGQSEATDPTTPAHLEPRAQVPQNGGMPVTPAQVAATGSYQNLGANRATVVVRALGPGTVGAGSISLELEDRAVPHRGTILTNVGAAYTPGTPFAVETATYDSGFTIQLPAVVLKKGHELLLLADAGKRLTIVNNSGLRDLAEGIRFSRKGGLFAYNFVPFVETLGLYFEDPALEHQIHGITVVTRVVGNRADMETDDPDDHGNQCQYRWSLDAYFRSDFDTDWQQIGLLDGNAARRYHLGESESEAAGRYLDRKNLKYFLATDGTETTGVPIGRKTDVNVEYLEVNRAAKVFWLRFGQETAMTLDHTKNPPGGQNGKEGMRVGDFNLLAVHVHLTPQKTSRRFHDQGSTTIRSELAGVPS